MNYKGWENWAPPLVTKGRGFEITKPSPRSKYRNVKVTVDGVRFDSTREADYWVGLKLRERAGQIVNLQRQVPFELRCADVQGIPNDRVMTTAVVSHYVADFVYEDAATKTRHVVDAKGHRTAMYQLKKKWLALQDAIVIEEV